MRFLFKLQNITDSSPVNLLDLKMNTIIVVVLLSVASFCYSSSDTNLAKDEVSALNSSSNYDMKYGDVNVGSTPASSTYGVDISSQLSSSTASCLASAGN